jgi:hypothetical protein
MYAFTGEHAAPYRKMIARKTIRERFLKRSFRLIG